MRAALLFLCCLLVLQTCLTGCRQQKPGRFSTSFIGSFDTVIQIIAYADSEAQFKQWADLAEEHFATLHRLYNIYQAFPGLNNLRTVNENAGLQPVPVDQALIELLLFSLELSELSPGTVNIALGPVLHIWHEVRAQALSGAAFSLPEQAELAAAAELSDWHQLVIDETAGTVFLTEPGMKLDVGAVAKGYATERVARLLQDAGMISGIISAGGNVRLIGQPADGRDTWQIGLQDPKGNHLIPDDPTLVTLLVNDQSIVTSGDYQRYFTVDDVIYHHLIDPQTLQPARYYSAVTVLAPDSGKADFISTLLFLLPYDESRALADRLDECEAIWVFNDGSIETTDGMDLYLKSRR